MIAFAVNPKVSLIWGVRKGSRRKSQGAVFSESPFESPRFVTFFDAARNLMEKESAGQPIQRGNFQSWITVAIDPTALPPQRNAAARHLEAEIAAIARRISASYSGYLQQEIAEQAVSHIWPRLSEYRAEKASFRCWCRAVLFHFAVDLWRRERRYRRAVPENAKEDPPHAVATVEEYEQIHAERRRALDRLPSVPPKTNAVHYSAVLLLKLRLALAASLAREMPDDWHAPPLRRRSEFVARCLPWRPEEEEWRCKQGWPALASVWQCVGSSIDHEPFYVTDDEFCELLSKLFRDEFPASDWRQWVRRAKIAAQGTLGDTSWNRLFGDLMPDRRMQGKKFRLVEDGI